MILMLDLLELSCRRKPTVCEVPPHVQAVSISPGALEVQALRATIHCC